MNGETPLTNTGNELESVADSSRAVFLLCDGQQSLFPQHELDLLTIDQPETRKRYTATSLEKNVAKRDAIVRALNEGWGLLRIARAFGVSHHLVSALRDSRPELVAIDKKQLSGQIGRILKLSADRFEDALSKGLVPAGQIPVAFGIFADKKAMIDGDASLVIEHRHRVYGSAEGFRAKLAAAVDSEATGTAAISQQKGSVVDVEVVSDTSEGASRVQASVEAEPGPDPGKTGGGDAAGGSPAG